MKKHILWLTAAAILVVIFGTIYAVTQQSARLNANMPQIQIAEDVASGLNNGAQPADFTGGRVNMKSSLASFTLVYDKTGKLISGNGYLNGRVPTAPPGILKAAAGQDYHFISWQPANNVRIAAVTVAANNFYVLSGRSLKEVEKNASQTFELAFFGGLISLGILSAGYYLSPSKTKQ